MCDYSDYEFYNSVEHDRLVRDAEESGQLPAFVRLHPLTGEELEYDEVPLGLWGEDLEAREIPVVRQECVLAHVPVDTTVSEPVTEWHTRDVTVRRQIPVTEWTTGYSTEFRPAQVARIGSTIVNRREVPMVYGVDNVSVPVTREYDVPVTRTVTTEEYLVEDVPVVTQRPVTYRHYVPEYRTVTVPVTEAEYDSVW